MIIHLFNSSSVSGPERLVVPALAKFGKQVLIINLREERIDRLRESDPLEEYARSFHLDYRAVTVRRRWDRAAIRELQQLLEQLDPDLVHVHSVKGSTYLGQARPAGRPYRIVSTHHGVHGMPDWKSRLYEWFYRKVALRTFDRTLCVSHADYEFLLNSGMDKDRLRLHLNGMDGRLVEAELRPQDAQRVRALWLPGEVDRDRLFLFGVVARLSAEKDHARIFQALSHLDRLPGERDWRCLIFGMGALEPTLRRQVRELGLDRRVLWMGYRKTVGDEFAGLDLLLSFSKAEGLPINLIEAGWAATPVMCTPVGGITDLIPDESYGYWVTPGELPAETARRLQTLLTPEGRAQLQTVGLRFQGRVRTQFTQEKWIHRLQEIYAELNVTFSGSKPRILNAASAR